jgi:hypothetical protein
MSLPYPGWKETNLKTSHSELLYDYDKLLNIVKRQVMGNFVGSPDKAIAQSNLAIAAAVLLIADKLSNIEDALNNVEDTLARSHQ